MGELLKYAWQKTSRLKDFEGIIETAINVVKKAKSQSQ